MGELSGSVRELTGVTLEAKVEEVDFMFQAPRHGVGVGVQAIAELAVVALDDEPSGHGFRVMSRLPRLRRRGFATMRECLPRHRRSR